MSAGNTATPERMRPLHTWPSGQRRALRYLFTDIDDTLSHEGRIPGVAFLALDRLQRAGLRVIPITGRPAGWCDHIARMWPVDAVVGENGALWFRYDTGQRKLLRRFADDEATRRRNREKLNELRERILQAVPGAGIASDQLYREADLAIDFCEDVAALPEEAIDRIVRLFEEAGATAKVSSIHVNGWFGTYDKLFMTRTCLKEAFGEELDEVRDACAFIGDSPNDQPMFAFFPHAIGVRNVRRFENRMRDLPRYLTEAPGGFGFVEAADAILTARDAG